MDDMLLEKIDLIRERMNVSYKEARQALDEANGSVVEALVLLEGRAHEVVEARYAEQEQRRSEMAVKGSELVEKVKNLIRQGNVTTIRVLHKDSVLFELPLTAGAATVLLLPQLALLAGIAVLFAQVTIQIEQPAHAGSASHDENCSCGEQANETCDETECPEEPIPQTEPVEPDTFTWTAPDSDMKPEDDPQ